MTAQAKLLEIVARNRAGETIGIPSWCTAHADVLRVVLAAYRDTDDPILIEATCNQVNQLGGYTGMTPADFRGFVFGLAHEVGVRPEQIILGGDHLGPNPWRERPAAEAMALAGEMVRAYAEAGFLKVHLDASMRCADDGQLSEAEMASRAAALCEIAERHSGTTNPVYVIGTEVPVPGGEATGATGPAITDREAAITTFARHRQAFAARGLEAGAQRIIGIVVQPGVDFGNDEVWPFDANAAAQLTIAADAIPGVVFEAHSTDYQQPGALRELVASHFGILKVGPELTFAFREAVIAMAEIEERLDLATPSGIVKIIETAMAENPRHWRGYIAEDGRRRTQLLYGLSDRVRYYWPEPRIKFALAELFANMDEATPEPGLVSQFAGLAPGKVARSSSLSRRIVEAKVAAVVTKYRSACRP